jgi:hypothetical protein
MLYMVIERFRDGDAAAVFQRFRARGRMLPRGLRYVDSWVAADLTRCFQLMACDDAALLEQWIGRWQDLVEFEVVAVVTSAASLAPAG